VIVVLPCGAQKARVASRAIDLYTGPYFKAGRAWALSVAKPDRIFIRSALHGLIPADTVIAPYDLRMGQPGSVERERIAVQVRDLGLADEVAVVLGGIDYRMRLAGMFRRVVNLVSKMPADRRGMGYQMGWLRRNLGIIPDAIVDPQ
jgi:hypothetical protein